MIVFKKYLETEDTLAQNRPHKQYLFFIFAVSFLTIISFKQSFILEWDAFIYNYEIIQGTPSGLGFGRIGFIYPFHWLWRALSTLGLEAKDFFHINIFANTIFGTLCPLLIYGITFSLTSKKRTALIAAFIYLFNWAYLNIVTGTMPEPMMYFFTLLSFNLIAFGLNKKKTPPLYLGAASFGFATLIKAHAILNGLFIATLFFFDFKKNCLKSLKKLTIATLIASSIILFNPIHHYITTNTSITATITDPHIIPNTITTIETVRIQGVNDPTEPNENLYLNKSKTILKHLTNNFSPIYLLLALIGFLTVIINKNKKQLLLTTSLFLPIIIHLFIGFLTPRYFIQYQVALSILAAIGLTTIKKLPHKKLHLLPIITTIIITINFSLFAKNLYLKKISATNIQQYGQYISEQIEENSLLIVGRFTAMFKYYIQPNYNHPNWRFIESGWAWPELEFEPQIIAALMNNTPVYINPNLLPSEEKHHLELATRSLEIIPLNEYISTFKIKPEILKKLETEIQNTPGKILLNKNFMNKIHRTQK